MAVKRSFDFIVALFGLLGLAPLFLIMAAWIKLDSKGPVFFRQERVGLHGVPFRIHKFRTMTQNAEIAGQLTVGKDSRVTKAGSFLRKYKLDELPQLIDVLVGHMSLVGPRPEVPKYVALYSEAEKSHIFSVRPGITDEASILLVDENEILSVHENPERAYIELILPKKIAMYKDYVSGRTFAGDFYILLRTLFKIFFR
ncbi:sugar transferase [Permianibacter fluminis]|uniref:sugar transferase n=1 Tax=Permianibacter fluminis TaxID=2738515 RepID=UPI001555BD9A|nr:sugar transferase [Permianibacter fluminis]